jgi:hypothetical protein
MPLGPRFLINPHQQLNPAPKLRIPLSTVKQKRRTINQGPSQILSHRQSKIGDLGFALGKVTLQSFQ